MAVSGARLYRGNVHSGGVQTLTLITPSTPGSGGYPSGIGWRDGSGTDTWGWDNLVPIDYVGGLDFSFGAGTSPPIWGTGWQFGIWNNSGTVGYGDDYQAWISGAKRRARPLLWPFGGALTVSAAGAATWAMLGLGFAALGFAGYRKARTPRAVAF